MKKSTFFIYTLFCISLFTLSCTESDDVDNAEVSELPWQANTRLAVMPQEDQETFIWYTDLLTNEEYWGNQTVVLDLSIISPLPASSFSAIDFYVVAEEEDGYNYNAPFDTSGKKITTKQVPESGELTLELDANDVYALFQNDFENNRTEQLAREGDIFLIYWVIKLDDGSVFDSRESFKEGSRYGMKVRVEDYAPPVWEGTFNFEWIEVSGGAQSWGGVFVGKTGNVNITHLGNQVYSMDNLLWDYKYGTAGKIYFDFLTGETYVEGNASEHWTISNIDGDSMDIEFWYTYSDAYDETGTIRFTRTDGANWPENIFSRER
ncbi:hypothetical protein KFZ70_05950 [Tamlana fucoidanivorans]|uniref:Uncharacterized protein n=1 Tax=Allotamlana fucoidanivorans TaxID=2583814 RepID=A0A5C4SRA5_9FLAO|nr:hypothetical protein [Tamlana fucoidanivorans]TNJ46954.1 hypothetical protein FGF67_00030 [Tamlana fucoidanivorans]